MWSLVGREAAAEPSTDSAIRASEIYAKGLDRLDEKSSHRGRYQTLGCIDPPEKGGHRVLYGDRHLVRALLVRLLLRERVPAGQIAVVMAGRSSGEIEWMFPDGVEMVAREEVLWVRRHRVLCSHAGRCEVGHVPGVSFPSGLPSN